MRNGTTSTGFEWEFDEAHADDMRFVDLISAVTDENTPDFEKLSGASKLVELLLGKEQKKALYNHIGAQHGGRVPFAALNAALTEIMSAGGESVKN